MDSKFLEYNCLDSACMVEAHNAFWEDLQQDFLPAYQLTLDMLEPILFMQTRGIKVNMSEMEVVKQDILQTTAEKQEKLNVLCGRDLNVNSSKDCQQYFYVELGIPPYYNEGKVTTDDSALQRLSRGTAKRPGLRQAKLVQDIRGLQKLYGTYLNIEFDKDSRLRCSYNPRGTKFGRLSSSQTVFGTGCLRPDAEVLTPDGWVRIDQFKTGTQAVEWNASTNQLEWGTPQLHIAESPGFMLECKSEQHIGSYTPDHRLPVMSHRRTITTATAAHQAAQKQFYLPLGGDFCGGTDIPKVIRLIAMVQADGTIEDSNIRLAFTKQHKIDRCIKLLDDLAIRWTEQAARDGYRRFCIPAQDSAMIRGLLGKEKLFGSWLLSLHIDSLDAFIDEVKYWDSHIRGDSYIYSTVVKSNAEWVATVAHLTGRSATMSVRIDNNRGYGSGNNRALYSVNVKPRGYAVVEPKHWEYVPYTGPVYCLKTSTSYFLTRYKGFIAITGNTNMQNLPQEFKRFLVADDGYVLWEVDKRQAEWVVMAYLTGDANMMAVVEAGKDTHVHTSSLMFNVEPEIVEYENKLVGMNSDPDLIASIRASDQLLTKFTGNFPRTMSGRQCGKKSNHGLNYDEGANKFALINELEQSEGKRIVDMYHTIYPGIRVWYEWIKRTLQKDRALTNCFGRKVRFMDQWGMDLWKAAYSMLPQSTVVDSLNKGMCQIYNDEKLCSKNGLSIDLLAQVHDSILLQIPIAAARQLVSDQEIADILRETQGRVYEYVSPELCYNNRRFKIATDMKIGLNWGGYHKTNNPNGMREVKNLTELLALETQSVSGS